MKRRRKKRKPATLRRRLLVSVGATVVGAFLLVLFILLGVLQHTLTRRDHMELRGELEDLTRTYEAGGLGELRLQIEERAIFDSGRPFFIRVATPENQTLLAHGPTKWADFDFSRLANIPPHGMPEIYRLEAPTSTFSVEILSARAMDGTIIQAGTSTRIRNHMLGVTATTFLLVAGPLTALIIALTAFNVSRTTASISAVTNGAHRIITTGRYDDTITVRGASAETEEMVDAFNTLLKRVDGLIQRLRMTLKSLAHDIRTPIARIRSRAELALGETATTEDMRDALLDTVEETQGIVELLQRFLDASEAESGTLNLHPEQVELVETISPVVEAYRFVSEERGIEITCCECEGCWITVDPVRVRQAVSNLLDNAVKFSPDAGTIRVRVNTEETRAAISVEDEGPGLDEAMMDGRIWDYHFRGDSTDEARGYGLGLTIVRAVAEAHGGSVDAANREGGGSRFTIRLPRTEPRFPHVTET
ncbi:MAG: sensor histidine kinase [Spirochaetaceae bacterium]